MLLLLKDRAREVTLGLLLWPPEEEGDFQVRLTEATQTNRRHPGSAQRLQKILASLKGKV